MPIRTPTDSDNRIFGIPCGHSWHALFVLDVALDDLKPKAVVELGTGGGGVALYLATRSLVDCYAFLTLDNRMPRGYAAIEVINEGCFAILDGTKRSVVAKAAADLPHPWLVYNDCGDGSCKQQAFEAWSECMIPGDCWCLHDWPASGAHSPAQWPAGFAPESFAPIADLNDQAALYSTAQHWLRRI